MRQPGIQIRLLLTFGILLLAGMLLINLVVLLFWQRDALSRERLHDRLALALLRERISVTGIMSGKYPEELSAWFHELYQNGEKGFFYVCASPISTCWRQKHDHSLPDLLQQSLAQAEKTGSPVVLFSAPPILSIVHGNIAVVRAEPLFYGNTVVAGLAVVRTLSPLFYTLWQAEKTILIYISLNLFVFGLICYFRIRLLYGRPVERLIILTERYSDQEAFQAMTDQSCGEFRKVARGMRSMLARIDQDKQELEETIRQLKNARDKLKMQQEEMIRTEKLVSLGRMAAGLAHEIGNPLGVVQGYLGLLEQSAGQHTVNHDYIKRAEKEIARISKLIRQLLDFARAPGGVATNVSVHSLLREIITMLQVQPDFREIAFRHSFGAKCDLIKVNSDQLRQVFLNCFLNSADAIGAAQKAEKGLIKISTAIVDQEKGATIFKCIQIRIRDNGTGIDKEAIASVFDPFYTTKEPGKGTGLGLSVSLTIVESLGGRMECVSEKNDGCEFIISLPLTADNG